MTSVRSDEFENRFSFATLGLTLRTWWDVSTFGTRSFYFELFAGMLPRAKYTVHLSCSNPNCGTWDNKKDWGGGCPLPSWVDRAALAEALRDKPTKHRDRVCQRCEHERDSKKHRPPDLVLGTSVINMMRTTWPRDRVIVRLALLSWTCASWAVILPPAWSPFFLLPFPVLLVPMSSWLVANTTVVPLIRPV